MRRAYVACAGALLGLACNSSRARSVEIEAPLEHFVAPAWIELVPPLRLPSRVGSENRVEVYLSLPAAGVVSVTGEGPQASLVLPAGSRAARVERRPFGADPRSSLYGIVDVRATEWTAQGERFSVLRPAFDGPSARLVGYEWARDDENGHAEATAGLVRLVERLAPPARRAAEAEAAKINNQCAGCHAHARAANARPRQHGVANRGTDATGSYQLTSIFSSRAPLEQYFPVEKNLEDRFVRFECATGAAVEVHRDQRRVSCADGSVPWGVVDVKAALAAGDERVQALCASRRSLAARFDGAARTAFAGALVECGAPGAP
jgi:hypothetical protein